MKRIVQLFLCVVCVAISTQAYGQGAVRGTVRDASNGETLPNANVVIDSLHSGAVGANSAGDSVWKIWRGFWRRSGYHGAGRSAG